ncbi:lysophospholipase L1-like esterase [Dyadobacter sp. BE34]|uniref:Lysophospholipase L1-like esterase n=1 Tax=Dyadobacter fermentans TaxID=94254 RepID=A0ABU1QW46_9BACT|nr:MULTISPECIES: SGNH/GDSL hydrolase family protein [Dyadobacter]MDR6805379.1 lysophospholipase L1-like esterase [Dyadobacter fermentans]MDR7042861.1 lysophospholipase L1-like esterase [Dyadobacter sp. BE242]MDR7197173.1 lysophospholipase L1-like esterase [Dyadobacter sp. BE34]MDR7215392.1 lysophospholipase L1-like esterase [Dyadobacter sp. BE31]MDR7262928.1 lysophospholipase L1-like esterase [Dyadobacter sp. BE32]
MPFLVLLVLEGALRLFGYGHDLAVFTEDPARKGYLVLNPHASKRYFANQQNATYGNAEPFTANKAPGVFRIFVLGESTTIGYPYMNNGSFHRWLQYRLLQTYPDRDFEVINLSLTAVNSYTVLDFGKAVLDYEPDAVLVYTGHNEYYGAMGVAATKGIGHNRTLACWLMKLRSWRLTQLMATVADKITGLISGENVDLRENLMKRMAADQQIAFGSAAYNAGIEQFRANMDELAAAASARGIPLLISNLVSNEKDLKPFISISDGRGKSADAHYQSGIRLYHQADYPSAKKEFVMAKELDALRFRAPDALNTIIKDIAHAHKGVTLVDARDLFKKHAAGGILGKETLLEHVHPNLQGYALLSEAFYQTLRQTGLLPASSAEMPFEALKKQMPITPMDSLKGEYEMMILKEGWPFNIPMPTEEKREKTEEEKLAGALVVKQISWRDAMVRLQQHYAAAKDTAAMLRVAEALALDDPLNAVYFDNAGKLSIALGLHRQAVNYLSKAFRMENSFERARMLFVILLKMDQPEEALPYVRYAAANNTSRFNLNELLSFVQQQVEAKKRR